jgi:DHA1 family tetracycline resistance protein-like MFS transporter
MSLSSIFGPWFMTYVFYYFTNSKAPVHLPEAPYYIAAVLMFTGAVLAIRSFKKEKQSVVNLPFNSGAH